MADAITTNLDSDLIGPDHIHIACRVEEVRIFRPLKPLPPPDPSGGPMTLSYYAVAFIDLLGQSEELGRLKGLPKTDEQRRDAEDAMAKTGRLIRQMCDRFTELVEKGRNLGADDFYNRWGHARMWIGDEIDRFSKAGDDKHRSRYIQLVRYFDTHRPPEADETHDDPSDGSSSSGTRGSTAP